MCVCVKERERVKEVFISTIIRFYHLCQPQRVTSGQGQETESEKKREICLYVHDCERDLCQCV